MMKVSTRIPEPVDNPVVPVIPITETSAENRAETIAKQLVELAMQMGASDVIVTVATTNESSFISYKGRSTIALRGLLETCVDRLRSVFS